MSKRGYISRYLLILKKLKAKPYSSFEELQDYISTQLEYLQMQDDALEIGLSKRTLQRDLKEIRNIFGIDIEYSKSFKGYFISQSETENMNFQRMIEAFDMFSSLNIAQDLKPHVFLENRKPQGTENLYGLLHAIKNNLKIIFLYNSFWMDDISTRTAQPYALKEFKNRWYLMAEDLQNNQVKSFALDRLSKLEITKEIFKRPANYNPEDNYYYCFGIVSPNDQKPSDIVLSFDPYQGRYIKTLPLHHTQEIVTDNEKELRIKLKLCITHDFIMELLSYGETVKVITPESLVNEIKKSLSNSLSQY